MIAFETLEEAAAGIERLARDPARHSAAAREIACEFFDARKVLTQLLERVSTVIPSAS